MIKLKQLKQTKKGVIFNICVSPGKKGFKIKEYSKWNNSLNINTKQKPQRGKANKEIEKKLGEILGKKTNPQSKGYSQPRVLRQKKRGSLKTQTISLLILLNSKKNSRK